MSTAFIFRIDCEHNDDAGPALTLFARTSGKAESLCALQRARGFLCDAFIVSVPAESVDELVQGCFWTRNAEELPQRDLTFDDREVPS